MQNYIVKYTRPNMASVMQKIVRAATISQAREQVKAQYNGQVNIISIVER